MPDTYEYSYRCFKVNFPDGDIYFYGRKHSAFYVSDLICFCCLVKMSQKNKKIIWKKFKNSFKTRDKKFKNRFSFYDFSLNTPKKKNSFY